MMGVVIVRPSRDPNKPARSLTGLVVAAGRADDRTICVSGECQSKSSGVVYPGILIAFYRGKPKRFEVPFNRWLLLFRLGDPGDYRLKVTGRTRDGVEETVFRDFELTTVLVPGPANRTLGFGISITSHFPSESITDEADDFVPYGDLTVLPLGNVTMTAGSTVIRPLHTFDDCTDLQFWSAQFPSLPAGTYTLRAEDTSGGAVDSVPGLSV